MSLIVFLGFRTRICGCVIGRYRELATKREITYLEQRGAGCDPFGHSCGEALAGTRASHAPDAVAGAGAPELDQSIAKQ